MSSNASHPAGVHCWLATKKGEPQAGSIYLDQILECRTIKLELRLYCHQDNPSIKQYMQSVISLEMTNVQKRKLFKETILKSFRLLLRMRFFEIVKQYCTNDSCTLSAMYSYNIGRPVKFSNSRDANDLHTIRKRMPRPFQWHLDH